MRMSESSKTVDGWTRNERLANLYRRFVFNDYAGTRDFLDRLAALSKETDRYPDISFGKTYANVTIHADDGKTLTSDVFDFARRVNALVPVDGG
ncbi:MAG: 4a-hydroxytetrahydrobiopterin dehydratase [Acidiferrobacterales bacterium]